MSSAVVTTRSVTLLGLGALVLIAGSLLLVTMVEGDVRATTYRIALIPASYAAGLTMYVRGVRSAYPKERAAPSAALVDEQTRAHHDAARTHGRERTGLAVRTIGYAVLALNLPLVAIIALGGGDGGAVLLAVLGLAVGGGGILAGRRFR